MLLISHTPWQTPAVNAKGLVQNCSKALAQPVEPITSSAIAGAAKYTQNVDAITNTNTASATASRLHAVNAVNVPHQYSLPPVRLLMVNSSWTG